MPIRCVAGDCASLNEVVRIAKIARYGSWSLFVVFFKVDNLDDVFLKIIGLWIESTGCVMLKSYSFENILNSFALNSGPLSVMTVLKCRILPTRS